MGLADGFASVDGVARDIVKAEHVVDFSQKEDLASRFAKRFGAGAMQSLLGSAEQGLR
jgi:protease IV